jgi:hypothetical protein
MNRWRSPSMHHSYLACFPKVSLCDLHAVYVSVHHPSITFWMPEPIFMKLGMNIMATEPISTAYCVHKFLPSVCVSVCAALLSLLGKGSVKWIPPFFARQRQQYKIVGRVIFYAVRVLSMESLWVSLCITLSLLRSNWVKTFPRQQRIVGGVVFYAVRVVSKESRWLVIPRTSCSSSHFTFSL